MSLSGVAAAVAARRAEMFNFLEQVVNMDSPTENKALTDKVGDVFQARAEQIGMRVEVDYQADYGNNRIARLTPRNAAVDAPRVLMIGHFDTVYAAGTVAERPFRTEGQFAYGPGVLDMKSGLTIGLFALESLMAACDGWSLPVTFIFNSDEEPGSPKSRDVIGREAAKHDLALLLEPGLKGPSFTIGRKGVGIFRMGVHGVEAHAGAEPEKGANSLVEAAHKATALFALNDFQIGTTVNPGVITGGTKPYVVPGFTELVTDIRVPTVAEQERILAALAQITSTVSVKGTRTELKGHFHRPPMEATEKTFEFVKLMQSVSQAVGFPLGTGKTGGASDGNLTAAAGVPTIDGLGSHGGRAHSPEEFIEIDSVEKKCRVLASFLLALSDAKLRRELA